MLAASDIVGITVALAAGLLILGMSQLGARMLWGVATLPLWLLVFRGYGLYDRDLKRLSHTMIDDVPWILHATAVGCIITWIVFKASPGGDLHFSHLVLIGAIAAPLTLILRAWSRHLAVALLGPERALLIGDERYTALLARKLQAHPEYGVEPVGGIASPAGMSALPLAVLGELSTLDLRQLVTRHRIDRVVVSHVDVDESALLDLLRLCKELGVKVNVVPQLFDAMGPSMVIDDLEGVTVLGINPPVLSPSSCAIKRATDIVGATAIIVVCAPLLAAIAVATKLDSRGPVFFRQDRIGRGGHRFRLCKFRTMIVGADALRAQFAEQSSDPHWLKLDHDPRVTRVGRILRLTSLDELPQLWNVLKGEMSLVGPRPIVEDEDYQLVGWARNRIDLTPGITGLWQVLGRTNIPFEEMVKLDYLYVTNWSLWADIRLIFRTLPVVFSRRGAN